jgi:RNA polymerase sigma-70 factor (ECF subfamily)
LADTQTAIREGALETADLRLAAAVLRKDRKATAEFVERYSDAVYAYLYRRLVPRTDLVDDMAQEVFLAAWDSLGGYEGRAPLKSWLLGIARHKVESHYRSLLREPLPLEEETQESMAVEPLHDERMDRVRLAEHARKVIGTLPEPYAAALLWRYWEKRSAAEMAEQTGKTIKAVERILARARAQFKRRWKHEVSA